MKKLCLVSLAAVFSVVLALAASTAPLAAATCLSQPNTMNCDNTDPINTGCWNTAIDLSPKLSLSNGELQIVLRYSTACKTAWAKVITSAGPSKACVQRSPSSVSLKLCQSGSTQYYTSQLYIGKNVYKARAGGEAPSWNPPVPFTWTSYYYGK